MKQPDFWLPSAVASLHGSHRIISEDGFPRTLEQAKALDTLLAKNGEAVSLIIEFAVDMAILEAVLEWGRIGG